MASNENSCKLKLSEFDETFSDDVAENTKVMNIFLVAPLTMTLIFLILCCLYINRKQMTQNYFQLPFAYGPYTI